MKTPTKNYSKTLTKTYLAQLRRVLQQTFKDAKRIAVKVHFGEIGNHNALKPKDIKPFVDLLYDLGKEPFLFDTSIAYPGPRRYPFTHKLLAQIKGWGKLAPIDLNDRIVRQQGTYDVYEVAENLATADGVLIISHIKGHPCTGFGGAIKNLGMGALSRKSKDAIHNGGKPRQEGTCIACKRCEPVCPVNGIKVTDKARIRICIGCSKCGAVCPTQYLAPKIAPFDVLLADGGLSATVLFKKAYYINIIKNISKHCDCSPLPGRKIAQDVGYLHHHSPISIDKQSHALVLASEQEDVFLRYNHKTGLEQVHAAKQLEPFFKKQRAAQEAKQKQTRKKHTKKG